MAEIIKAYVALYTTRCLDGQPGEEVRGAGYKRQLVELQWRPEWNVYENTNHVEFYCIGGSFGEIVATGITDAQTGGRQLWVDNHPLTPFVVHHGDSIVFEPGHITVEKNAMADAV